MHSGHGTMGSVLGNGRGVLSEEVPAGYKRTEVGVIPEEWNVASLGEMAKIATGGTPPTHDSTYYGDEYPFVSPVDLGEAKHVIHTEKGLSPKGFAISRRFPAESILFVSIGSTIGKCGVASVELTSNQQINAILPSPSFSVDYLYYTICSAAPRIKALAGEQAVPIVNKTQLSETLIALAPKPEQLAIAEALSDVDGLLAALEALIAKKRAVKQAAMQQLLTGKTRLPGFSGVWETKRLEEIGDISGAGVDKKVRTNEVPVRLVNYLDVYHKTFLYSRDLVHRVSARSDQLRHCKVRKGDVFFTPTSEVRDDIGCSALAMEDIADGVYSYHVVQLRLNMNWDLRFRAYAFDTEDFYAQASTQCEGSGTRYVITLPKFRAMTVRFPPTVAEQRAIATVLSDIDAEIATLERRRDKTRAIKQGMMQQLLTGRVRLAKPETTTEELAASRSVERKHNWQFNEAVVISVLAKHFGTEQYPLGRMRYTNLSYLLHRREEGRVEGYLKKAAGPYNPKTKYGGPEKIALKKGYADRHKSGKHKGFIAGTNIEEAGDYFTKWYGDEALEWLEQFRFSRNDELELLTTVDMTVEDLRKTGKNVSVESVKETIRHQPDWRAKLDRPIFSDANLARAIGDCQKLFDRSGRQEPV